MAAIVMVAPVAAAAIWRAINDEEHHAEGFLPVNYSEVVEGRPRGKDRVLFQYYARAGIGRWWASRVFINDKVHEATGGKVWEKALRPGYVARCWRMLAISASTSRPITGPPFPFMNL